MTWLRWTTNSAPIWSSPRRASATTSIICKRSALRWPTWPIERVVWYRDTPYAIREPDARPAGLLRLEEDLFPRRVQLSSAVLERKIAGCSLYASQIGFQFGGAIALGEKLTAFHGREAGADSSVAAAATPKLFSATLA